MDALKFALKTLVFTAILVVCLQMKVGGVSVEEHSYQWLKNSSVSQQMQSTAAGGAKALKDLGFYLRDLVKKKVNELEGTGHEKASK